MLQCGISASTTQVAGFLQVSEWPSYPEIPSFPSPPLPLPSDPERVGSWGPLVDATAAAVHRHSGTASTLGQRKQETL